MYLPWLETGDPQFPTIDLALDEPNGLLAAGGELTPHWLTDAYQNGIFPWFSDDDPILWWSPSPRCVMFPEQFHLSKSLRKTIRNLHYEIRIDQSFEKVMRACAAPRADQNGTWISEEIIEAYTQLHRMGIAHSVELWVENELVGGLYGLNFGRIFFGESMFSLRANASKIVFHHLCGKLQEANYAVIDCQVYNPHLASLGAVEIDRERFKNLLQGCSEQPAFDPWLEKRW